MQIKLIISISVCHFHLQNCIYMHKGFQLLYLWLNFSHLSIFYLERQAHVHLIGSHSVPRLCQRSLWVCQLEEMAACISAWNKAPAPKWQALDIVGKWMLNSLCNHQQQPRVWKINCTLAKGKGNCFARYTTKSCLWAIHLSDVFAKKVLQLSLLKSHTGLLWAAYESGNKEMSNRVNPISVP